jgi:hypothetical protein
MSCDMVAKAKTKSKATGPALLVIIGAVIVLLAGFSAVAGEITHNLFTFYIAGSGVLGVISGLVMLVAGAKMNSSNVDTVHTWAIVALVFSAVSLGNGGGLILGFLLGLVGSIIGLTHKA